MAHSLRIKKGDTVLVARGSSRGTRAVVLKVLPGEEQLIVEGVNLKKKRERARSQDKKGQTLSVPRPIHRATVRLYCNSCGKGVRVGMKVEGAKKTRFCRSCKKPI